MHVVKTKSCRYAVQLGDASNGAFFAWTGDLKKATTYETKDAAQVACDAANAYDQLTFNGIDQCEVVEV